MTSPYLQLRLRTFDEALEDKQLKDLGRRQKNIQLANERADLKGDNVYRLGQRLTTKIGGKP